MTPLGRLKKIHGSPQAGVLAGDQVRVSGDCRGQPWIRNLPNAISQIRDGTGADELAVVRQDRTSAHRTARPRSTTANTAASLRSAIDNL
ncbi:MAG: hypothetical protein R2706_13690 [Acidimicrobiales bacterium]